jgi:hypothetical protein
VKHYYGLFSGDVDSALAILLVISEKDAIRQVTKMLTTTKPCETIFRASA